MYHDKYCHQGVFHYDILHWYSFYQNSEWRFWCAFPVRILWTSWSVFNFKVVCWTTDHYHQCLNLSVDISRRRTRSRTVAGLRLCELQCCHVVTGSLVHIKNEYLTGLCVCNTLSAYNGSMRCMIPWELRYMLGGNRNESGIIIL